VIEHLPEIIQVCLRPNPPRPLDAYCAGKEAELFNEFLKEQDEAAKKKVNRQIRRSRRKVATLLEELSLRTSRIQPMMKKLEGILSKMRQLEQYIAAGPTADYAEEDIGAMKQEFIGMQEMVLETPEQLEKRLRAVRAVFAQYEEAKRNLSSGIFVCKNSAKEES